MSQHRPGQLRAAIHAAARLRHYSPRTERAYMGWIRRFVIFHGRTHPRHLGADDVAAFLNHLAVDRRVSGTTQNQALNALVFLYRDVVNRDLGELTGIQRARERRRLPVVLGREEVRRLLRKLHGTERLVAASNRATAARSRRRSICSPMTSPGPTSARRSSRAPTPASKPSSTSWSARCSASSRPVSMAPSTTSWPRAITSSRRYAARRAKRTARLTTTPIATCSACATARSWR